MKKSAVERIMEVLGLTKQSFYEAKTEQGLSMKMEGDLEVGAPIYVATEEGLIPAPPGVHKLDDGSEIEVGEDGTIAKIKMGDMESDTEDKEEGADGMDNKGDKAADDFNVELQFGDVELKDGTIIRMEGEEPMMGVRCKMVGYDGTLSAITDGTYETKSGKVLSIVGGAIKGVQTIKENEERGTGSEANRKDPLSDIGQATADVFTEAEADGGMKLESPTFDVGEKIEVVKDDGTKEPAPDGEHEIILKDEKGNPVKMRVVVKDGMITERENVEEAQPEKEDEMSAILDVFKEALKGLETKIDLIASKQKTLDEKFQKFSKEPAGSRVYTQKTINEDFNPLSSKYEGFRKLREDLMKN